MIASFRHKGLRLFFESGNRSGIRPEHASKLARLLDRLDASTVPRDMNLPGYRLHRLSGDLKGYWSVGVSGNWRLIFGFDGPDVVDVDYVDYH